MNTQTVGAQQCCAPTNTTCNQPDLILEVEFADKYGVEIWADVFNFRILPALDQESKSWFLVNKCSKGYIVREIF